MMLLVRIIAFMGRSIMDSDLSRLRELISDGHNLFCAIELLVDADIEIRDKLDAEIDREITELDRGELGK